MTDRYGLLVGGEEQPAVQGEWFASHDSASHEPTGTFAGASAADVDRAVDAARTAFPAWSRLAGRDRGRVLQRIGAAIAADAERLALLETLDCGKRLSQSRADVANAARYFEFFGNLAGSVHGEQIPVGPGYLDVTIREPFGVCAQVSAWNFPLSMAARSAAAALAAGNTVVVKTAELAPLTTALLGRVAGAAGLPGGVLNILHGYGAECGAALVAHPDVDLVTFTGSGRVGREVASAAALRTTPVVLELGGKSPAVVFADADLDTAGRQLARGILDANGQSCDLPSLGLVEASVHDRVLATLRAELAATSMGPGVDDHDWGPLISERQRDRVAGFVDRAVDAGADVVSGGQRRSHHGTGWYYEPTVLANVRPDAEVAQDEVFGPVLSVVPFEDEADALRIANGTRYGLAAYVWTGDVGRAVRMGGAIRAGQVHVNCFGSSDGVVTPFGGMKQSGWGREKGAAALHTYTQLKNLCLAAGHV